MRDSSFSVHMTSRFELYDDDDGDGDGDGDDYDDESFTVICWTICLRTYAAPDHVCV